MARQSNTVSADDILNFLNSNSPAASSTPFTDWLADTSAAAVAKTERIAGAVTTAFDNFGKHYTLERGVQKMRAQNRLRLAAEEAAARINALR